MEKVILFAVLLFGAAYSLVYEHCGENEGAVPLHFYIFMCHSIPCNFNRKNETAGIMKFIAAEEINRIDTEVHAHGEKSQIAFAGEGVHRCSGFREGECKYEAGTQVNYYFLFPLTVDSKPEEVVQFKMTLKNENGTPLTCAKFKAKIRDVVTPEPPVADDPENENEIE